MADISIVVGTLDRPDYLKRCVESVIRETRRPFYLYITDAGSKAETIDYLKSIASERIIPIFVGRKLGQARAYNDVFKAVDTPYVCWLSDDNEVVNNGLDLAADILERDERIGMIGLKVKDLQGPFVDAPYIGGLSTTGILNVNQGMVRTRALAAVSYFSEEFRDYGIDPDLTAKILLWGWDIVYTRPVAIHHYRLWETDKTSAKYALLEERQKAYLELYDETYRHAFRKSKQFWTAKGKAWEKIRQRLGERYEHNSAGSFLGLIPRDWHNIFGGRYISLLDPLLHWGRPYYLRQRMPKYSASASAIVFAHVLDRLKRRLTKQKTAELVPQASSSGD